MTVTLPDAGERFVSLEALDEDHYTVAMFYGPGTYTFSFDNVSTRYALIVVRIMVDPANRADLARVHELQEAITVSRQGGGRFVIPNWDPVSQAKVRVALQLLANTVSGDDRTFGAREEVDPVRHLIGTATQWDRCPPRDIAYLHAAPRKNDGRTIHRLTVGHVPVDGFWSLSVYDINGHFLSESHDGRTVNSLTAPRAADGSIVVQFGGCEQGFDNCLQITKSWCYVVRLYRPRAEILGGKWKFPNRCCCEARRARACPDAARVSRGRATAVGRRGRRPAVRDDARATAAPAVPGRGGARARLRTAAAVRRRA